MIHTLPMSVSKVIVALSIARIAARLTPRYVSNVNVTFDSAVSSLKAPAW